VGVSYLSAGDYTNERLTIAKATCLSVAIALGDEICGEEIVVVGGLVPALLYGVAAGPLGNHVGTNDLDLALDLAILASKRYNEIRELFLRAGFRPDRTETGTLMRQRWRHEKRGSTVDFLIPVDPNDDPRGRGKLQSLARDFAAIRMLGLDLALQQKIMIGVKGRDLQERYSERTLPICSPHIFVVLKAIAMKNRDKNKDAYDLLYVLASEPGGPQCVASRLVDSRRHPAVREMVESLERDFATIDSRGPKDFCAFLGEPENEDLAADAMANVQDLLRALRPN
jgi:hypothetical protein